MPTMERPPTRNTMAKSASVGTARRAISWIVRLAALPAVEIGGVDAIRWSMSYLAFDFDVHVCTCKRNARRLLIMSTTMSQPAVSQQEAWMRGPIEGIGPMLMPVAHALVQAREDLQ